MTSNGYSALVIVAGIGLIGYLFTAAPETASNQMPLILTALGGFIVLLQKQGDTDKKVEENTAVTAAAKVAATESVVASKDNAHALGIVTMKQDQTNGLVDGHLSTITAKMDAMALRIENMEREKVIKAAETADIISAITGTPLGVTPAHGTAVGGTTIEPGGPTTIVVDSDHPVALEAEKKLPKGKRPGPGDQL